MDTSFVLFDIFFLIFVQLLCHTRQKTFHSKGMSRCVLFLQHTQSSISHQSLSKTPTGVYFKVKRWEFYAGQVTSLSAVYTETNQHWHHCVNIQRPWLNKWMGAHHKNTFSLQMQPHSSVFLFINLQVSTLADTNWTVSSCFKSEEPFFLGGREFSRYKNRKRVHAWKHHLGLRSSWKDEPVFLHGMCLRAFSQGLTFIDIHHWLEWMNAFRLFEV